MGKIYQITEDYSERRGGFREEDEDKLLEKAFHEGCEHGYKKAMREMEHFDERRGRSAYREGFEEKIEKLKRMYK